jgi:hypothetical protein
VSREKGKLKLDGQAGVYAYVRDVHGGHWVGLGSHVKLTTYLDEGYHSTLPGDLDDVDMLIVAVPKGRAVPDIEAVKGALERLMVGGDDA